MNLVWMQQALNLSAKARYTAWPNPMVGCVIVRDGVCVGEGYHRKAGEPHAEVNALLKAKEAARGATLYVTLEPCCHTGRTPPCVDAIIKAGIKKVVVAMLDPDSRMQGKGLNKLRKAGIEVETGICTTQAIKLNQGYVKKRTFGKPWIVAKSAMSLDGRIALANGDSKWITGVEARAQVQKMRADSQALITGAETIRADDAIFTVRDELLLNEGAQTPLRVILDGKLSISPTASIWRQPGRVCLAIADNPLNTLKQQRWLDCYHNLPENIAEVTWLVVPQLNIANSSVNKSSSSVLLDLDFIYNWLCSQDFHQVLLESGSKLLTSFLKSNLIDEWTIMMAPKIMGASSKPIVQDAMINSYYNTDGYNKEDITNGLQMANLASWSLDSVSKFGDDLAITYLSPKRKLTDLTQNKSKKTIDFSTDDNITDDSIKYRSKSCLAD